MKYRKLSPRQEYHKQTRKKRKQIKKMLQYLQSIESNSSEAKDTAICFRQELNCMEK